MYTERCVCVQLQNILVVKPKSMWGAVRISSLGAPLSTCTTHFNVSGWSSTAESTSPNFFSNSLLMIFISHSPISCVLVLTEQNIFTRGSVLSWKFGWSQSVWSVSTAQDRAASIWIAVPHIHSVWCIKTGNTWKSEDQTMHSKLFYTNLAFPFLCVWSNLRTRYSSFDHVMLHKNNLLSCTSLSSNYIYTCICLWDGYWLDDLRFDSYQSGQMSVFSKHPQQFYSPPSFLHNGHGRRKLADESSLPSSAGGKNNWRYIYVCCCCMPSWLTQGELYLLIYQLYYVIYNGFSVVCANRIQSACKYLC